MEKLLALVTGGSRGIGEAIAQSLAQKGYRVITPTRSELDLSEIKSLEAWISEHAKDPFDVLVNNAGINNLRPLEEITERDFEEMMQVNLKSALRLIQTFAPGMGARGWGRILNISTIFSMVTKERRGAYSMMKAAINALTRSAAVEFGPRGVLSNALCPGYVETALTHQNNSPQAITTILESIPLRRMANVGEVAKLASFLCSEENSYITGQCIVIDGGFTCQ
jgi:3-oxoacyl-[acyl-carrier protein] reductase